MKDKIIALALLLSCVVYTTAQPNRIINSNVYWEFSASINDIIIYDLSGKMIHHLSHSRQIDISDLSKGIYFVKILTDSFTCTKKLVKL